GGKPINAARFLADIERVRASLPNGTHVLNVCADRYRFTVGLAAALVARKVSLLPSTHTREVIRQLAAFAPDVFCLTDEARCAIDLPRVHYPEEPLAAVTSREIPQIDAAQLAAYVFTSGSTGTPLPHRKTWSKLVRCVRDGAQRLGLRADRPHAIVSTVPAQHMYGFESSVLVALQSGSALCAERPFYPADICRALTEVRRPRMLVTTPVHLRTLLAAAVELPQVELVVCATAPLSQNLAREVEARFATRLLEIYGSTETGQIATRRTADTIEWQLWPDVQLTIEKEKTWARGGHVEEPTLMCDVLELTAHDRFLLHGRTADLVNIAGKRSSIAYLNHQLNAIPGVIDGTFLLPNDDQASAIGVTRLAALVVAPKLDPATLTQGLRERIDPAFLPRPLLFVDQLPRNATGKLPQAALHALLARHQKTAASS
ncbi:MAG TPA: AMP-binding protein, partial [Steroidobacteraceae bacterium]